MVRSRTWPSPGVGAEYSSTRKSDALGSPTGRDASTMRFADWDMVVPPVVVFCHSERSDDAVIPGRCKASNPESRDSGFASRPGMTVLILQYHPYSKISGGDFDQRRLKCRGRSRQIRKGKTAVCGLLLRVRCRGADSRDRLCAIEQPQRRREGELMAFAGRVL